MNAMKHSIFIAFCLNAAACGKTTEAPATDAPAAAPETPAEVAPPTPTVEVVVDTPPEVVVVAPSLAPPDGGGLNGLSIRYFEAFKGWVDAASKDGARYVALASSEVSNAASAAFDEDRGAGDECRSGWLWLEVIEGADKTLGEITVERFAGDCCGANECERTTEGQHLHFLRSVAKKDWAAVAAHVPDEGAITFVNNTPDGEKRKTTGRTAVAAGEADIAGCGPLMSRPSCDEAIGEDGAFTCRCDAGGYHVTYAYQMPTSKRGLATVTLISADEH